MNSITMKLTDMVRPEKNVRIHTEQQLREFERSVKMFGQIRPIVVDEKNVILAGNGLYETLLRMGYEEALVYQYTDLTEKDTVSEINSLEEEIADILHSQTTALVTALKAADGDWDAAQENVPDMIDEDDIAEQVTEAANAMYELNIPKLATVYIQESDGELVVDTLRQRTSEWFASWCEQLGNLM